MKRITCLFFLAAMAFPSWIATGRAQSEGSNELEIAFAYHKITGEPLDLQAAAELRQAVQRATQFDRPDVLKAEIARLQSQFDALDPTREFTMRVSDTISQYDHDRGEFSITLFMPGYFVPIDVFRQYYQIAFANAESVRRIPMPKEEARQFDARLNAVGRSVTNEIRFRITGKGDPAGAVTGQRVVRAELTAVRVLDRSEHVLFIPQPVPFQPDRNPGSASFDVSRADVAGFRVGVRVKDLETTLNRLFGASRRGKAGPSDWFAGTLSSNENGCVSMLGRNKVEPGNVCVTAFHDADEVVRSIRIERIFRNFDLEVLRRSLTQKYGTVADARGSGGTYSIGWGPEVASAYLYYQSGPHNALTAHYFVNDDLMTRGGNRIPEIRVVLQLVDANWASAHGK